MNTVKMIVALLLCCSFYSTVEAADRKELPIPLGVDISERFVGTVHRNDLITTDDVYKLPQTNVISFEAGSHSGWHTHGAMTVVGIAGMGLYQEWGKEPVLINPGDVVQIPAGVSHYHGATKDSAFQQFVIYDSKWKAPEGFKAHTGMLNEEEYEKTPVANTRQEKAKAGDMDFLFNSSLREFQSPNFNKPVYLSKVLSHPNAADSPEWVYVAFPQGTYNRWHSHKTGQVLIATDGVGYHQIKGEKLQMLKPGDVAFCPPGVVHWHGAAPDSNFAHIAINPQDNHEVTWYDFPDEEYHTVAEDNAGTVRNDTIVKTTAGLLAGDKVSGGYRYLGVAYAEADELFVPAKPVTKWQGIKTATNYGSISYQSGMFGQARLKANANESNRAQNLNIWTPGIDNTKRPVMIWLHGGGFSAGSANEPGYDGANLSRAENVVVVGINHRLGVYGHLDLSAYGNKYKYSNNVGMLDIVAALKWVKENIAAFGGDQDNVTLFGESGGGAKVLAMMSSPYAKGLFQRGIVESGATETMGVKFADKKVSQDLGKAIVEKLGITENNLHDLQRVSYEELQRASAEAQQEIAHKYKLLVSIGEGYAYEWEPVTDGDFLPENPVTEKGFAASAKDYPLMIGSNLNEWNYYMADALSHKNMPTKAKLAFQAAYPNEPLTEAENVDTLLRLPLLKITAHKADQNGGAVYSYIFTKQEGVNGSYHGAEIPYVFGNQASDKELSRKVMQLWASFARAGKPKGQGIENWEPYTRQNGAVMIIDEKTYLTHHHDEKLLKMLAPDYQW